MSIQQIFSLCGGVQNIARVLLPDDKLIIEVKHDVEEPNAPEFIKTIEVQGETQLVFRRPADLTFDEALALDQMLAALQKHRAKAYQTPIESEWRPSWHISPPIGLLNDPNGFIYHNGQYHLFYQWYPYGCEHKDKHWVLLTSDDLVNWTWQRVALTPSAWFDSHGVFSGHSVSQGDTLYTFYTGNTRIGPQRDRHTTQCVAIAKGDGELVKQGPIIEGLPPGVTEHIRDPKVFKRGELWWMVLGAQTTELQGRLAVYTSRDLKHWDYQGLFGQELGDFGYMWECPDMFELGGQDFAMFCPQGIEFESPYHTIGHHNGLAKAQFGDEITLELSDFQALDYGFDFYAPQTMQAPDGRRILCAWMGLPDEVDQPSSDEGWAHQLTCFRQLDYRDGVVRQYPIRELESLIETQQSVVLTEALHDVGVQSFDLSLTLAWGQSLNLFEGDGYQLVIKANAETRQLILDRSETLNRAADVIREVDIDTDLIELRILADTSSVEIFINQGQYVMTSRVFTSKQSTCMSVLGGDVNACLKTLKAPKAPFANE